MRNLFVLACVASFGIAGAQVGTPQIDVFYTRSNSFNLNGGGSGNIEGLEVGISQPLIKLPLIGEARVGVSTLLNGVLSGKGVDSTMYRVYAIYNSPSATGVYGIGGFFYGSATGKNGAFNSATGFGLIAGFGYPLTKLSGGFGDVPGVPKAAIELKLYQGAKAALRGISIGLTARF